MDHVNSRKKQKIWNQGKSRIKRESVFFIFIYICIPLDKRDRNADQGHSATILCFCYKTHNSMSRLYFLRNGKKQMKWAFSRGWGLEPALKEHHRRECQVTLKLNLICHGNKVVRMASNLHNNPKNSQDTLHCFQSCYKKVFSLIEAIMKRPSANAFQKNGTFWQRNSL